MGKYVLTEKNKSKQFYQRFTNLKKNTLQVHHGVV